MLLCISFKIEILYNGKKKESLFEIKTFKSTDFVYNIDYPFVHVCVCVKNMADVQKTVYAFIAVCFVAELAREMNFTVDEINHIRLENPNSLTAQSFMLLKKWVSREGKNATSKTIFISDNLIFVHPLFVPHFIVIGYSVFELFSIQKVCHVFCAVHLS